MVDKRVSNTLKTRYYNNENEIAKTAYEFLITDTINQYLLKDKELFQKVLLDNVIIDNNFSFEVLESQTHCIKCKYLFYSAKYPTICPNCKTNFQDLTLQKKEKNNMYQRPDIVIRTTFMSIDDINNNITQDNNTLELKPVERKLVILLNGAIHYKTKAKLKQLYFQTEEYKKSGYLVFIEDNEYFDNTSIEVVMGFCYFMIKCLYHPGLYHYYEKTSDVLERLKLIT